MRTIAVMPVKSFARAKKRLADAVGGVDRRELAEAMVGDVLATLATVPLVAEVIVVTAEPVAVRAAGQVGAAVVRDPDETGQSQAAARGIAAAVERGAGRVLLVPGDCPALDAGELGALLGEEDAERLVVVVPDRHGSGTNALLLSPPDAMAPSFGPGSLARHAALGRAAGAQVRIRELASLGLDVDTPGDLATLRTALAELPPAAAPRTRAVLDRLVAAPTW